MCRVIWSKLVIFFSFTIYFIIFIFQYLVLIYFKHQSYYKLGKLVKSSDKLVIFCIYLRSPIWLNTAVIGVNSSSHLGKPVTIKIIQKSSSNVYKDRYNYITWVNIVNMGHKPRETELIIIRIAHKTLEAI